MPKKYLSPGQIESMKVARLEYLKRSKGLVWKINKRVELWADEYQYILRLDNTHEYNFSTITEALLDLTQLQIKENLIAESAKDVERVLKAVADIEVLVRELLSPLGGS